MRSFEHCTFPNPFESCVFASRSFYSFMSSAPTLHPLPSITSSSSTAPLLFIPRASLALTRNSTGYSSPHLLDPKRKRRPQSHPSPHLSHPQPYPTPAQTPTMALSMPTSTQTSGAPTPSDSPATSLRTSLPSSTTLNALELDFSRAPKAAPGTPIITPPMPMPLPISAPSGHATPERTSKPKNATGQLWGNRLWDRAFA